MLGRLLRTRSFSDIVNFTGPSVSEEQGYHSELIHMPDDLKVLLYGTKNLELNGKFIQNFRIMVAQEMGEMLSKHNYQVVLDYSTLRNSQLDQISLSELKEYIFGSCLRITDTCQGNKFKHVKSAEMVIITRIFYPDGSTCRMAISFCVPECYLSILTECWAEILKYFDECQRILIRLLNQQQSQFLPRDLASRGTNESELIIQCFHKKIIPLLCSFNDTPRLFLYPNTFLDFIHIWIKDVFNWLEVKDGHRLQFLPVLLAKLKYDFSNELYQNGNSKIIILSSNMIVANKLIFIISAFLKPKYSGKLYKQCDQHSQNLEKDVSMLKDIKYSTHITSKGWEIPKRQTTYSLASISSDETSAHVIQPSSLRSSSSIQYLSSSITSNYGSYGSWFKKSLQSPSTKTNDSFENQNSSNSSLPLASQNKLTPQPSPSIAEYDEYPWNGITGNILTASPKFDIHRNISSCSNIKAPLDGINIRRSACRIEDTTWLDEKFDNIFHEDTQFTITPETDTVGSVLEVEISNEDEDDQNANNSPMALLPRYTSYLPHLNHWFQLQAFPITPYAERKIVHTMKDSLKAVEYSKTLFISLRSREIKELKLEIDRDNNDKILQSTKILFQNGKKGNTSSKFETMISSVEDNLKKAICIWEDSLATGGHGNRNDPLFQAFQELVT